jgi:hypothetical protein
MVQVRARRRFPARNHVSARLRIGGAAKNMGLAEAKPKFLLVGRVGIEPTTNGLREATSVGAIL